MYVYTPTVHRHGAQKTAVMEHFVNANDMPLSMVDEIDSIFEDKLVRSF